MSLHPILQSGPEVVSCYPWPRYVLEAAEWIALARAVAADSWVLLGHWADTRQAHALYLDPVALAVTAVSVAATPDGYPALSPMHPGAAAYERMVHDLWGHVAHGALDTRAWLDHGAWPQRHPLSPRPPARDDAEPRPSAAPVAAADLMQLALGPIWGDREEAAQLRLCLDGAAVRHAHGRLGYTHKGTLGLMRGKSPRAAARLAARLSGDATVAHAAAFALAAEAASEVQAPPRAVMLRVVMSEIERISGHLDNLAETAVLADVRSVHTMCGALREAVLRASHAAFGHRLMMDCVVPGGVAADIADGGGEAILRALGELSLRLPAIRQAHDRAALHARLAGIGRASGTLIVAMGVGGVAGRASGRGYDLRTLFAPGYDTLAPRLAMRPDGDAAARQQLRIFEIEESVRLISAALRALPDGPVDIALPPVSGEGIGCAESIRGDIWHWLRLDHGQVGAVFPRDPGWALWPLAERVLENATVEDAALIRLSLALPASGIDL